jgi:hypothetical protein
MRVATFDVPPHQQPSLAFFTYLLYRLRSKNPNYKCYIPPRQPLDLTETQVEHTCINLHDVNIFSHAQDFDEDPQSKGRWSTLATNTLAFVFLLLMIPVLPVILLVYTVPGLLKVCSLFLSAPNCGRYLLFYSQDTFHVQTKGQDGSDTRFHPYRWSRLIAIWIVYVPRTKLAGHCNPFLFVSFTKLILYVDYQGIGGLTGIVFPSFRPSLRHAYKDAATASHKRKESRVKAKENLEKLASTLMDPSSWST